MSESENRDTHTYDDPQTYDDYREDIAEREALAKCVPNNSRMYSVVMHFVSQLRCKIALSVIEKKGCMAVPAQMCSTPAYDRLWTRFEQRIREGI
jgi:hypothetical protein